MAVLKGRHAGWISKAMKSKEAKPISHPNTSTTISLFLSIPFFHPQGSSLSLSLYLYITIPSRPHKSFISGFLHHNELAGVFLPLFSYSFPHHHLEFFLFCSLFPVSSMRPVDKDHHLDRPFNFYSHTRQEKGDPLKPPKGWMVIKVGMEGEEEKQRFVVPVEYLKHPLFVRLLEEAEREYRFDHPGAITIPCRVEHFQFVRGIIDREHSAAVQAHRRHYHRLANFSGCFRA